MKKFRVHAMIASGCPSTGTASTIMGLWMHGASTSILVSSLLSRRSSDECTPFLGNKIHLVG
jgi:hypothetical protein